MAVLPAARSILAVCAHPDDESFGLGALLAAFAAENSSVAVLCFTHGEASTLGAQVTGAVPASPLPRGVVLDPGPSGQGPSDPTASLGQVRARELAAAAEVLGLSHTGLLDYPDGRLAEIPVAELAEHVTEAARATRADLVVAFDEGGVTGHPDHDAATAAATAAAVPLGVPVLGWTLPERVATALNAEFGTRFVGRAPSEIDLVVRVERDLQREAIACHASQSTDNPVLWRRLELLGDREHLRWLRGSVPSESLGLPVDGCATEAP